MEKQIQPVLLGADLNCYNVARAYHEQYGVRTRAFGKYAIGATMNTKIIDFTAVERLDDPEVLISVLSDYAEKNRDRALILHGCTDEYVELISKYKDKLSEYYAVPYIDFELLEQLTNKAEFYRFCEKYGIPYPKTTVITRENSKSFDSPYGYPVIIKPAVSASYWKCPFDGMKKVYRARSKDEAQGIIDSIFNAGYPDSLIIQDMIPGDDSSMYVLTAYSGEDKKVRMMCLGHVLLEEHTPKGLGNHCAIITEENDELLAPFKVFLEDIGFVGFANFDIKYDSRDRSFRAFEINVRQGRSNYYVTASGNNIAKLAVEDKIMHIPSSETVVNRREIYWRYIPDSIVKQHVSKELFDRVKACKRSGRAYSSMRYRFDLKGNLKRYAYVLMHEYRHKKKFAKYYPPEEGKN